MKKICQDCGQENAEKDKFCIKCGKELLDAKVEPATQDAGEYKAPVAQPRHEKKKKQPPVPGTSNKMALGVGAVAIVLSIAAISSALFITPAATIGTGSVDTNELASGSVTGGKVADGTLTDADVSNTGISKIANNAITSAHILNGAITILDLDSNLADSISGAANITNESITSNKIKNGTIATSDLANNAITSAKIATDAVTSTEIAADAVGSSEIAANAVGSSEIATGGVGADEIAANGVGTSELANNAVSFAKMETWINFGTKTGAINGSTVTHGLASTPTSVVITPVYDSTVLSGNYVIHANVHTIGSSTFTIGLWYETFTTPLVIYELDGTTFTSGVSVCWIAMYQ